MTFPPVLTTSEIPPAIILLVLALVLLVLALVLLVLAARARRRLWKIALGVSVPVVLMASCTGLIVAGNYPEPLPPRAPVNVPAPVPTSLSVAFFQTPPPGVSILETLNARTGALRWQQSFGPDYVWLAADTHTLYLTTNNAVMAVRASDGSTLWRTPLKRPADPAKQFYVGAAPILANGLVFVSFENDLGSEVEALRASDGALAWSLSPKDGSLTGVLNLASGQGLVFVGSHNGTLIAVRSSDGMPVWSLHPPPHEAYFISPFFDDGVVYGVGFKQILALRASDGTQLWSYSLLSPESHPQLGIGASSLYVEQVEHNAKYLYSLSAQTGQMRWKYQIGFTSLSNVSEAGDLVYVASDCSLDALRVSDGQLAWQDNAGGKATFGTPLLVNDVLFVSSVVVSGHLPACPQLYDSLTAVNAFNPTTGALYWRSVWPSLDESAPLIVSDSSPGG